MKPRKFKLIKKYPNSEEIGSVWEEDQLFGGYVYDKPSMLNKELSKEDVEDNPEFFEEIIEKQYEILSYYCKSLGHTLKASQFTNIQFGGNSEWSIHSIRRLSDDEVFFNWS